MADDSTPDALAPDGGVAQTAALTTIPAVAPGPLPTAAPAPTEPDPGASPPEGEAVMSLLEGFGDHVMDEVGRDLVPGVERISARFHGRRQQRTPFERAMLRITGMDLKMEQYRKGEAFVAGIERLAGAAALRRLWDGPETLPRPEEIDSPASWVRRMGLNQLGGGGS